MRAVAQLQRPWWEPLQSRCSSKEREYGRDSFARCSIRRDAIHTRLQEKGAPAPPRFTRNGYYYQTATGPLSDHPAAGQNHGIIISLNRFVNGGR